MIGYLCEAVILAAGIAFMVMVVRTWSAGSASATTELPAELTPTVAIDIVPRLPEGEHLAPRRRAPSRSRRSLASRA